MKKASRAGRGAAGVQAVDQVVLDSLPCGITVFDRHLRLVAWNQAFARLLDFPPALVRVGTPFEALARHRAERGDYGDGPPGDHLRAAMAALDQSFGQESQCVRREPLRHLDVRRARLPDGGLVTSYLDVTAALSAEAARHASEERQRRALAASGVVLWDCDLRTRQVLLSENWWQLVGAPMQEGTLSMEALLYRIPAEQHALVNEAMGAALQDAAGIFDLEHQVYVADGAMLWVHSRGQVMERDATGRAVRMGGTSIDITTRRRAEQAIVEAKEAAEAANRGKSQFITTMSHEIRTPLNGVLGITRLLLSQTLENRHRRLVELLDTSGQALMALVDDVLDLGKIEAGQLTLDSFEFDLAAMLEDLAELYELRAAGKGLTFHFHRASDVPAWVRGDGHRLRQILNNLLANALKFTESGGFGLQVWLRGRTDARVELVFRIVDSGVGIDAQAQRQLFQRFVQADGSTTRRFGGSGLGLAIVKDLCQLMGGTIGLKSEPGAGSRFAVNLSFDTVRRGGPGANVSTPGHSVLPTEVARSRVLVVEDNPTNRIVVVGMLDQAGWHDVVVATDGLEALAAVANDQFAVILMDCHMPHLDGFETTRRMRADGVRAPIIAITAGVTDEERSKCFACGMNDVVTKPIAAAKLHRTLKTWASRQITPDGAAPPLRKPAADVKVFDAVGALERLGGDRALLQLATDAYLAEWPRQLERLQAVAAAADATRMRLELHTFIGASSAVGAIDAAAAARVLLAQCRAQGVLAPETLQALDRKVDTFAAAFRDGADTGAARAEDSTAPGGATASP